MSRLHSRSWGCHGVTINHFWLRRMLELFPLKWWLLKFTKPAAEMVETLVRTEYWLTERERAIGWSDHLANYPQLVAASVRPVAISLGEGSDGAAAAVSVSVRRPQSRHGERCWSSSVNTAQLLYLEHPQCSLCVPKKWNGFLMKDLLIYFVLLILYHTSGSLRKLYWLASVETNHS